MAARRKAREKDLDATLARLSGLAGAPVDDAAIELLRIALTHSSNHVVARAAELVASLDVRSLEKALIEAFPRFLEDAVDRDKTCSAKNAIVRALEAMESPAWDLFALGMRHVQLEPEWGGSVDTAATLRASCAAGLARSRDAELIPALIELLVDKEKIARMGAAQALGVIGQAAAIPVLRLKVLVGDAETEVISECLASLLVIDAAGVEFTARFLEREDLREVAALALGQSRRREAFLALKAAWPSVRDRRFLRVILLAIAVMRIPESVDLLLGIVRGGEFPGAAEAVRALAIYRDDAVLCDRVRAAIEESDARRLNAIFEKEWASKGVPP